MKLWLSKEEPYLKDEDIIWVKNSWDALKIIDDFNSQIAEEYRCPYDSDSILDAMNFSYLEGIYLDCIPESMKFLEKLLKMKYNKYYKFCICYNENEINDSKKYFYKNLKDVITSHSYDLDWFLLEKSDLK